MGRICGAVGVVTVLMLVGCSSTPVTTVKAADAVASASVTASEVTTAPATVPVTAIPVAASKTGGITVNSAGAVLPNSARTPGAINTSVTQATIGRTICVSGWTTTVRPSSSVTTSLKVAQLASGYTYKGDTANGDYEEDHLISLELGGAPSAEANLWPEPYNAPEGARVKDQVENKLHSLICGGTISLATAQRAIASNWWTAYQTYVGGAPAASTYKPAAVAQPVVKPVAKPGPAAASVASAKQYANCTAMHVDYKGGVALPGAVDHRTSGHPIYTPTYSQALYNANTGLDRDKDHIACEA
jgi:Excalibur calcium-binding domain